MVGLSGICHRRVRGSALALALLVLPGGACAGETVLHDFDDKGDGVWPLAGLVADGAGNLYGTTADGSNGCKGYDCGTVFKLSPDGTETILYAFCTTGHCNDGATPWAGLIIDKAGNLYGTTAYGGEGGGGTIFKLAQDGTETVLYSFSEASGYEPRAGLLMDGSGNLYGTTTIGGDTKCRINKPQGCGTVFKLAPDGTLTVLHAFKGGSDGAFPMAGVIMDSGGNLDGTTYEGGGGSSCAIAKLGCGTVFSVTQSGMETVMYAFQDGLDGGYPLANLLVDDSGNLYGTAWLGGAHDNGTVFEIWPDGTETTLHAFCANKKCTDGREPRAGLIADSSGNLYGTTFGGGTHRCQKSGGQECGTAFELASGGNETVLYSFAGKSDGRNPLGGVIADGAGNLYGTTELGGKGVHGYGTVFEISK